MAYNSDKIGKQPIVPVHSRKMGSSGVEGCVPTLACAYTLVCLHLCSRVKLFSLESSFFYSLVFSSYLFTHFSPLLLSIVKPCEALELWQPSSPPHFPLMVSKVCTISFWDISLSFFLFFHLFRTSGLLSSPPFLRTDLEYSYRFRRAQLLSI